MTWTSETKFPKVAAAILICFILISPMHGEQRAAAAAARANAFDFPFEADGGTRPPAHASYGIKNEQLSSRWAPCYGEYMSELLHAGEDWFRPIGTKVRAIANGTVVYTQTRRDGDAVVIRHDLKPGWTSPSGGNTIFSVGGYSLNLRLNGSVSYTARLTWNASPQDLDANFYLPDGTRVYYDNRGSTTSHPWAEYYGDDRDGFGPEIITISRLMIGTSTYAVEQSSSVGTLAGSGATVQVYRGTTLVGSRTVPSFGSGTWWTVFRIDGSGNITWINSLNDLGGASTRAAVAKPGDKPTQGTASSTSPVSGTATETPSSSVATEDLTPPRVALVSPDANATLTGTSTLVAEATDDSGIARVVFQARSADGGQWTALGTDRDAPYRRRIDLGPLAAGSYLLRVVATDGAGIKATSEPVLVTVVRDVEDGEPVPEEAADAAESDPPADEAELTEEPERPRRDRRID